MRRRRSAARAANIRERARRQRAATIVGHAAAAASPHADDLAPAKAQLKARMVDEADERKREQIDANRRVENIDEHLSDRRLHRIA